MYIKEGKEVLYKGVYYYVWQIVDGIVFLLRKGDGRPIFIKVNKEEITIKKKGDVIHVSS